jgi:hypothetical protein
MLKLLATPMTAAAATPTTTDALTTTTSAALSMEPRPATTEPTIASLRRDVAERRHVYREALGLAKKSAPWGSGLGSWQAEDPSASELMELNGAARCFLRVQNAKLAYDAALEELRRAEDDLARNEAKRSSEATRARPGRWCWSPLLSPSERSRRR